MASWAVYCELPTSDRQPTRAEQRAAFEVLPDFIHLGGVPPSRVGLARAWETLRTTRRREAKALLHHLSAAQQEQAKLTGYIPVIGSNGGRWLVQWYPQTLHMWRLPEGGAARHKCLVFSGDENMPPLDWVISKVLLLEANESIVERTAL